MGRGKKYALALAKLEPGKAYEISEGIDLIKSISYAKFDETVEISVNLNLKKSHSIRDTFVLPHQFAGEKKVLVFAKGDKAQEAEAAGAAFVGAEDLVEKIKGGWMEFDICVATPDMMKEVGKLGPVLGRRGLMPNPKTQTVTMDVKGAVNELKLGRIEFRADKSGVVHLAIGKVSMSADNLKENVETLISELKRKKPSDLKGDYVKSVSIASTMGPGIRLKMQGAGV